MGKKLLQTNTVIGASFGILLFIIGSVADTFAQWSTDPLVNNAISTAIGYQASPAIVEDDSGGAIIAFIDDRNGACCDIYAQKITSAGVTAWTADGVAICLATGIQDFPTIISDSAGGAIITWVDKRSGNYDVYAQRINAKGEVQWTTDGVAISTATDNQQYPVITSDQNGGAIITWRDSRNGNRDIYAQRINATGQIQWTANGVAVCTVAEDQDNSAIMSDGNNGAIIIWEDDRNGATDIYAQRINSAGTGQWTSNGIPVCTADHYQYDPKLTTDGSGGAIAVWWDNRGSDHDIYAQRISAAGQVQWTANGVAVCTKTGDQDYPVLVSDGSGGAFITWIDNHGGEKNIYAQLLNTSGALQWNADGVPICIASGAQDDAYIISDESGGAIISWSDSRNGNYDIYAQRIIASGDVQWTTNGVAISTAAEDQYVPVLVSDKYGGAIIAWEDYRDGGFNSDIYAQNVSHLGILGVANPISGDQPNEMPTRFALGQNYPNPFNPTTVIPYQIPSRAHVVLKVYNVLGQEVATLVNSEMKAGSYEARWDARNVPSGLYIYMLKAETFSETRKLILVK